MVRLCFLSISFVSHRFAAVRLQNAYNSLGFFLIRLCLICISLVLHRFAAVRHQNAYNSLGLNGTTRFLIIPCVLHRFAVARLVSQRSAAVRFRNAYNSFGFLWYDFVFLLFFTCFTKVCRGTTPIRI